jgi:hypothetical protein
MTRFHSARQLASWAGMCPGNHESAGTHHGAPPAAAARGSGARSRGRRPHDPWDRLSAADERPAIP